MAEQISGKRFDKTVSNATALSATIHEHDRFQAFYDKHGPAFGGFPGIWAAIDVVAVAMAEAEILCDEEYDNNDWISTLDRVADYFLDDAGKQPDQKAWIARICYILQEGRDDLVVEPDSARHAVNFSKRGMPLVLLGTPDEPTITVENYLKWYSLYVVHPDRRVEGIELPDDYPPGGYGDHCFEPTAVQWLAEKLGYEIDDTSLDTIRGRWAHRYD